MSTEPLNPAQLFHRLTQAPHTMSKPAHRSRSTPATPTPAIRIKTMKRTVHFSGIALMVLILSWGYATHLALQGTHLASP